LLCWRYLRTRYLALVCIVSVMLGVATLIVVNSVMAGFSNKLRDRLHGLLSDVVLEAYDYDGFPDPEGKMALIRSDPFLAERVEAMTPTLEIFAMVQFFVRESPFAREAPYIRPIRLIGIKWEERARLGGFKEYLVLNRDQNGSPFEMTNEARERYRFRHPLRPKGLEPLPLPPVAPDQLGVLPAAENGPKPEPDAPEWARKDQVEYVPEGIILGHAIAHFRDKDPDTGEYVDVRTLAPGDDVIITTVKGQGLKPVEARFVVTDYFRSEMSEYDAQYVFVPLEYLQQLRSMENRATSIQIRLKDYNEAKAVVAHLQALFKGQRIQVQTWEDKQGPLLAAISVEKGILNVLLFLIIGVAGFGILAIFSMIVTEKTRDIGILKALGASNGGVLKIFLGYGLLLGFVGATLGTVLGLAFTWNINDIEKFLAHVTGQEIFPRNVYYFNEIPTYVYPLAVLLVNLGAVLIAVLFSILPALRAALLHPVRALRYE
jgi:lipoprotein-releasing system permease protein